MAIDLTLNYSSGEFLEPKKKTGNLGERFKLAELDNFNTPDLEQSPDSFLRPGETLEDWDVSFRRPNAHGGLQRRNHLIGAAVPIYTGLATLTGITIAAAKNYLDNNPEIYNKLASNFDGNMEKLKENISKYIPAIHGGEGPMEPPETESFPDQSEDWSKSFGTGEGTKIPEQKKLEPPVNIPPQIKTEPEGFPIPKQKGWQDYVLYKKTFGPGKGGGIPAEKGGGKSGKAPQFTEEEINASLPPEIDNLSEAQLRSWIKKNAVKEGATENINIYKAYQKYIKDFKKGYVKSVPKDFDDLFTPGSIYNLGKARGFTINAGNIKKDLPAETSIIEITDNVKKDSNFLDAKLKDVNLNQYLTFNEILDFLEAGKSSADQRDLRDLIRPKKKITDRGFWTNKDVKTKTLEGYDRKIYHLGDIIKNLKSRAKDKIIRGEGEYATETKKRKELQNTIDKDFYTFNKALDTTINAQLLEEPEIHSLVYGKGERGAESKRFTKDLGHLIPVDWISKDSKVKFAKILKDELYGLNDIVEQHVVVNQEILKGGQGAMTNIALDIDNFLEKNKGKKWNAETIKGAEKINSNLDSVLDKFKIKIKEYSKNDPTIIGQEKTLAGPKLNIRPGSTIKISDVFIDKSRIDDKFIYGNINIINPKAKKLSDLSKAEQNLYKQRIIDNKIKNMTSLLRKSGYELDEIKNIIDLVLYGKAGQLEGKGGVLSKKGEVRIKKATGGPVVPTIPYRENFESGSEPENKMSDEQILESIRKGVFELEQNWNTEKSMPGKILDVADTSNWPYYAARMLRAGMSVAEISAKLPFVSMELLGKLATQPAFKVKKADTTQSAAELGMGEKFMEGVDDSWLTDQPHNKLEGTGLFTEAFKKLMPGSFADKTGLNSLIESQEQAMQDKGMSQWPEIAGKNIEMGLDITLPFGYVAAANKYKSLKKLLTPLVKDKNVNKVIEEALTGQGMSRREFNTLIASGGMVAAIKALGLDSLFKGARGAKELKAAPIQMLKNSSTKMPAWFPKFIDEINKKMTYEGSGMYTFKGTDDFLPGFHIERISDDYYITGKNDYGQEFQVTYESPKWEGDKDGSFYNEGEFRVDDAEPVHMDPDGNVDFDGVVRDDIDEVLGGTSAMEEIATGTTRKNLTKGEKQVLDAEGRAQSNYDMAKDEGLFDDVE